MHPSSAMPDDAPDLGAEILGEIAWAREQVGAQGNESLDRAFFKDRQRATNSMILKWVTFFCRVTRKVELWSIEDGHQHRLRLPSPLTGIHRLHLPVDVVILHPILTAMKRLFEELLPEVNEARQQHGQVEITWDSLNAPDIGTQAQIKKLGPGRWIRFLFDYDKFFSSNKKADCKGAVFQTDGVQIVFKYEKRQLNEAVEIQVDDEVVQDMSVEEFEEEEYLEAMAQEEEMDGIEEQDSDAEVSLPSATHDDFLSRSTLTAPSSRTRACPPIFCPRCRHHA